MQINGNEGGKNPPDFDDDHNQINSHLTLLHFLWYTLPKNDAENLSASNYV